MLYKEKKQKFDERQFMVPTSEYRGAPFWAWNCKLKKELLLKEIEEIKDMGMGGVHIHCRVGLDTPYLGEEFFENVEACKEKLKKEKMLCWLYDEDRWPSGSAGGIVTKNVQYRSRFLVFEPEGVDKEEKEEFMSAAKAVRSKNRFLLGSYRIILNEEGRLKSYQSLKTEKPNEAGEIWSAWLEVSGDTPWFNNQAYVNTLDKNAINQFIEITHQEYYKRFADEFGKTIPAIFTDEPQTCHKEVLSEPFEKKAVILPFTDDFDDTFQKRYGFSILECIPELIWERENGEISQARYFYHRHLCERFSEAFGDNVGKWCEDHNIALTGHMMNEWTLYSQTMAVGEVMRPMKYFTLPGMDMLCDRRELSTAKQVQSIARQMGREGVMSEIYGVTGWNFDFRNHKLAGDWQAALGVTVRVPHLSWVSMEGEAKRDYPASIGYQSPWYQEYSYIEDHFARLNTAMTRGKPKVAVGIIHPIESYWSYWGNQKQTATIRQKLEAEFENIIRWMLYGLIDFDFISEAVLGEETRPQGLDQFIMGEMRYQVIVVPDCFTLRQSTYKRLKAFQEAGGNLVFMGAIPEYIDGVKDSRVSEMAEKCSQIDYSCESLLNYLEVYRSVDIFIRQAEGIDATRIVQKEEGIRTDNMFYQIREEEECRWLFVCHVNRPVDEHITFLEELKIQIRGEYKPVFYDTLTGQTTNIAAVYSSGDTIITVYGSAHDSFLFRLVPGRSEDGEQWKYSFPKEKRYFPQPKHFLLEEDNCCLLDLAEYAFDDQDWNSEEEILRIDNRFRKKLGYPLRMEALAQPWVNQDEKKAEHSLKLRFLIESEIALEEVKVAMENPEHVKIFCNGESVEYKNLGWYVDESIRICGTFVLKEGMNTLELQIPFGIKTNIEWCYLLGDFGVKVLGSKKVLTRMPKQLYYGNFVTQGLPFYAGNLTYETEIETEEGVLWVETSHYRGALLQVTVDGSYKRNLIFAPYRVNCGEVSEGRHTIQIKVYGNRANAFGPVHNGNRSETWYGPNLWRTTGCKWSYEYQLEEMGILTTPSYWIEKAEQEVGGKKG